MGLFDKIRDNARDLSMKAIDATREYDEEYSQQQTTDNTVVEPTVAEPVANVEPVAEEADFIIDEPTENNQTTEPKPEEDQKPADDSKSKGQSDSTDELSAETRKSKVTELTKEEHEKAEKEKRTAKAKQAAKERLAKSYTPSYKKSQADDKADDKKTDKIEVKREETKPEPKASATKTSIGIVDVTPSKFIDPVKKAIYARERAALTALASQRKLNGTVPLYVATHMNFKTRVFINRIEYSGSFGKNVLPVEQVAWIKVRNGGTGVIIETIEGKRVVMVVKQSDRLSFVDAVMKVQALQPKKGKFKDTQTIRIDKLEQFGEGIDEIEKLAKLYDKGILSRDEFELKKKQILGL